MLTVLLLIHILLNITITVLFLYLVAKAAFYGHLTERERGKGVFKSNNASSKDSAAASPHCEWNKQSSRPPTLMISQTNCLLCGSSGGNNCVSSLFGSHPFSHIWKYPQAVSQCTNPLFEFSSVKQCRTHICRKAYYFLNIQKVLNKTLELLKVLCTPRVLIQLLYLVLRFSYEIIAWEIRKINKLQWLREMSRFGTDIFMLKRV